MFEHVRAVRICANIFEEKKARMRVFTRVYEIRRGVGLKDRIAFKCRSINAIVFLCERLVPRSFCTKTNNIFTLEWPQSV